MGKIFIKALSLAMSASISISVMMIQVSADFKKTDKGITYTDDNGKKVTGLKTIDGKTYYFDVNGIAKTGFMKFKTGTRYFDSEGVMKNGWVKINKKTYYFDKKGIMATGTYNIGSKQYTFDKNGVWNGKAGTKVARYDFRKSNWGDTLEDVQKVENNGIIMSDNTYMSNTKIKLSDNSYDVGYIFDDKTGKLEIGAYMLTDLSDKKAYVSEFNTIFSYYEKKYGNALLDGRNNNGTLDEDTFFQDIYDKNVGVWKIQNSYIGMAICKGDNDELFIFIGFYSPDYFNDIS